MPNEKIVLHQVLAAEKARRAQTQQAFTSAIRLLGKDGGAFGFQKTYEPLEDNDGKSVRLEPQSQEVAYRVESVLSDLKASLENSWNLTATKEQTNTAASADIVFRDKVIAEKVPVGLLLHLEKQLQFLANDVLSSLPTLTLDREWVFNEGAGLFQTAPTYTQRVSPAKVPLELSPATPQHPAQVTLVEKSEIQGTWSTIHYSGAITSARKRELLERVHDLIEAVRTARQRANLQEAQTSTVGSEVLNVLFG